MDVNSAALLEAEQAVIGSMLTDADTVPFVLSTVDPKDFAIDTDRRIFEAVRALFRAGEPVDAITVADKLGWAQDKEMRTYMAELMEVTPTSANCREYVDIMHEQAMLRAIRANAMQITTAATLDDCRVPFAAMTEAFSAGQQIEAWTMSEMLVDFGDRQASTKPREYITIGIDPIDRNTFLERGDMMMLGGAPSDGKTALALTIAYHMSKTLNVGFYSLETGREKLEDRLISSGFQISFDAIKKGEMTEDDWNTFAAHTNEASTRRLTVLRASGMTADQIAGSSRARGFDAIFIDYGQLIKPVSTKNTTRAEQMAEVSRTLHTFAQSSKTLVVLLLQLTRQERGSRRERDMFDLGESSQFEKDADLVLLLYRPPAGTHFIENDKSSELLDPDKTRILRIAKQKEGRRTRLPLAFDGDHQSFYVLGQNPHDAIRSAVRSVKANSIMEGQQTFTQLGQEAEEEMPF